VPTLLAHGVTPCAQSRTVERQERGVVERVLEQEFHDLQQRADGDQGGGDPAARAGEGMPDIRCGLGFEDDG
jgi:hypothetical protein